MDIVLYAGIAAMAFIVFWWITAGGIDQEYL